MISLKITKKQDEENAEVAQPVGSMDNRYPWGTRIQLEQDSLDKLGIVKLPAVGDKLMIEAKVEVISVRQSEDGKSVELQITDMDLENDGDEVTEGELTRGESGAMSKVADKMKNM